MIIFVLMLNKKNIPLTFNVAKLNRLTPAKGRLLIAAPFLEDPSFKRAVILLVEHNEKGSLGLVLNKDLNININDTLQDFPEFDTPVYVGGPVDNDKLFYIHTLGEKLPGSKKIIDGLYWGGDFEQLKSLINMGLVEPDEIRFFIGYSGWDFDQLNSETEEGSWVISDCGLPDVMGALDNLCWRTLLKRMGNMFAVMAEFPEDPSLN